MFYSADARRTFSNSGGGLFPRHRLDSAQTAFLVMVSLVDLVNSLEGEAGFTKRALCTHTNGAEPRVSQLLGMNKAGALRYVHPSRTGV